MDAHDTNQPLNQVELEEEKKTVEVSEAITETPAEDVTAEVQPEAAPKPATKEDVLNQLKELAQDAENANKQDIDNLKQSFYKLHNAELEAAKVQFTDNGGNIEDFVAEEDPPEEEFNLLMGVIKEKRSKQVAECPHRSGQRSIQIHHRTRVSPPAVCSLPAKKSRRQEGPALHRTHGLRSAPLSGQGRSCGEPAGLCEWFRQVTIK